jgi:hypothetical protein
MVEVEKCQKYKVEMSVAKIRNLEVESQGYRNHKVNKRNYYLHPEDKIEKSSFNLSP